MPGSGGGVAERRITMTGCIIGAGLVVFTSMAAIGQPAATPPAFEVARAGGGSAQPAPGKGPPPGAIMVEMGGKGMTLKGSMDMGRLVNTLSNFMDRPIIDNTDLKGTYDVELSFMPDESLSLKGHGGPMMMPSGGPGDARMGPPQDANAPGGNIFQALQSFGLKLEARKDPVASLVTDHANRVPTEN